MRFELTDEQQGFGEVLDDLLGGAGTAKIVRGWADGDHGAGLDLWRRLAELGVTGLLVPEEQGGLGADAVDLTVAFEALGRHAVPGPWVESAALLPALLGETGEHALLAELAAGSVVATASVTELAPYALDADVAGRILTLDGTVLAEASAGPLHRSVDPVRRLFTVKPAGAIATVEEETAARAIDTAVLACSAQLLGAGERLLAEAVAYAKARKQFGRVIGEYQALKHALADVRVGLDFARPLLHTAALGVRDRSPDARRDVSAAKVTTSEAAYRAARTALQVHGAIGYTAEHDLGLWITKVRALQSAWGTPAQHRARILAALTETGA